MDSFDLAPRSGPQLGPRQFSLLIVGHGIEAMPRWPSAIAHLADGTLVVGPIDVAAAKAHGNAKNVLIRPGTPPGGLLAQQRISQNSVVTYSTAERGTTQLVLGNGMQTYDELLALVRTTGHATPWRIVTDHCELAWPPGLLLRVDGDVTSPGGPFALTLDGVAEQLITFHGPYPAGRVPSPAQLLPPTHVPGEAGTLAGECGPIGWCSSSVEHAGTTWVQRYYTVALGPSAAYLVRAQSARARAPEVLAAAEAIARSLRPRG